MRAIAPLLAGCMLELPLPVFIDDVNGIEAGDSILLRPPVFIKDLFAM